MDDAELVRQVLQVNRGAYVKLVNRWTRPIRAQCVARVHKRDVVDDLVQETFLRGLDRLATLRQPEKFGSWVYTIARRLCEDWLKDPHHKQTSLNASPEVAASIPACNSSKQERIARVRMCVDRLCEEEREVINLYYSGGGLTYQKIADLMGVSFGQVNKLLTSARKNVRACMEGDNSNTSPPD